jgi:hypothetical protein
MNAKHLSPGVDPECSTLAFDIRIWVSRVRHLRVRGVRHSCVAEMQVSASLREKWDDVQRSSQPM